MIDKQGLSESIAELEQKIAMISTSADTEEEIKLMRKAIRMKMRRDERSLDDLLFVYNTVRKIYNAMWQNGYTLEKATSYVLDVAK